MMEKRYVLGDWVNGNGDEVLTKLAHRRGPGR